MADTPSANFWSLGLTFVPLSSSLPKGQFGAVLKSMNYADIRTDVERQWRGLRLREENEVPDFDFPKFGLDAVVKLDA